MGSWGINRGPSESISKGDVEKDALKSGGLRGPGNRGP